MKIDWFTVIAQIINFLVLVWLLKRFLYQPILDAVDKREQKITSQLTDAEAKKEEARLERKKYQEKNASLDRDRAAKMETAKKEAEQEKQRLFEEARKESGKWQTRYEATLREEAGQMTEALKQKMQDEVFAIVHKTLNDLADSNLEEQLVNVFVKKLKGLDEEEKKEFAETFADTKNVVIRSAFDLPADSKAWLEEVIREIAGKETRTDYESGPELVSGIAIHADRFSLSWNIDTYLEKLRRDILDSLPQNQRTNKEKK